MLIDRLNMTIAVDWDMKLQTKQKKYLIYSVTNHKVLSEDL